MPPKKLVPSIKTEIGLEWRALAIRAAPAQAAQNSPSPPTDTPCPPPPPPPPKPPKPPKLPAIVSKVPRRRRREDDNPCPDRVYRLRRGPHYLPGSEGEKLAPDVGGADDEVVIARGELDVPVSEGGGSQQSAGDIAQLVLNNLLGKDVQPIIAVAPNSEGKMIERLKISIRSADDEGEQQRPAATQTVPGQSGQESDAAARKRLWLRDLETIRRPEPLVPVGSKVLEVTIPKTRTSKANTKKDDGREPEVINLIEDSPTKSSQSTTDMDPPSFYGLSDEKLLIFQDQKTDQGKTPAPTEGLEHHRLLMKKFRDTYKLPSDLSKEEEAEVYGDVSSVYSYEEGWPNDHDQAHKALYKAELTTGKGKHRTPLIKGLPLVEEVPFLCIPNYQGASGECFWKAIAIHIYGDWRYHHRVKGEHFAHFCHILRESNHPRHESYKALNKKFYATKTSLGDDKPTNTCANLYQILCMPGTYTPLNMFDVTADLYHVFLIIYTLNEKQEITFVTTRGSYNSRHLFILYVGNNHYQPLVPNEFWASEFRLPMITLESTNVYPGLLGVPLTNALKAKDGIEHRWRRETDRQVAQPMFVEHQPSIDGSFISRYGIDVKRGGESLSIMK